MPTFEPIAIIGEGCVLPGALDPDALWDLIRDGKDVVAEANVDYWGVSASTVSTTTEAAERDHTWSRRGGYVQDFDRVFDPGGYAVDPATFDGLDPLFLWTAFAARQAIERAGYTVGEVSRGGVVLGNLSYPTRGMSDYAASVWTGRGDVDARNRFMSGLPSHLVAEAVGFDPDIGAYCLDAACASSLYAIKLACDWLHQGRADVMLAGGANHADDLFLHIGFCALQAMSKTGQSRPFHADADGLVPAEGAGFVLLKRLADAIRDGDTVHGVIRGIGLSNDGRGRGLLTPAEDGQVRAMRAAYDAAGLEPRDVSLVECHATGTPVGDGTELRSMAQVFGAGERVPIASMKSNVGHLITASGAAGVLKILGAIRHKVRPPSLHAETLRSELDELPFRVVESLEPWQTRGPRRAAISNFGFGGNNAHLIIEEYTPGQTYPSHVEAAPAVAVVGLEILTGGARGTREFIDGGARLQPLEGVELDLREVRFPPNDLDETLPQQLALLQAMMDMNPAILRHVDGTRAGVFVGMGCDPEIARHGLRWRSGNDNDGIITPLQSATVVGKMPNIVANRLNSQFDLCGPSFTVSSEELSGLYALDIAIGALGRGELDVALVGAVDLSGEPVHRAALSSMGLNSQTADVALIMALMRPEQARNLGLEVLATVELPTNTAPVVHAQYTSAHAAAGLVEVASAICDAYEEGRPTRATVESALSHARVTFDVQVADRGRFETTRSQPTAPRRFPAHPAAPVVERPRKHVIRDTMAPAPALPSVRSTPPVPAVTPHAGTPVVAHTTPNPGLADWVASYHAQVTSVHLEHLAQQKNLHHRFLGLRGAPLAPETPVNTIQSAPQVDPPPRQQPRSEPFSTVQSPPPASTTPIAAPPRAIPEFPGPKLDKKGLEVHASGAISEIFGPLFAQQDGYPIQCRMPEPPLLLADRLLGIDAEPGVLSTGRLWTETDITADAWYMHDGRMPPGLMIESGQADLMLISWMGIDFMMRGERRYRLLGCELTYHQSLPKPGEVLRYDIHIDGHANQGDVRLFFFHYDCTVDDEPRLTVRGGQAGFFTEEELDDSAGVLWTPEDQAIVESPRLAKPPHLPVRCTLERDHLEAFAAGDLVKAFGDAFEMTATHTRTPRIASGNLLFIDECEFDFTGGPWGRGYLRAVQYLNPDQWFFEGHFKNDPCMPGTLMFEGCMQTMAVYLTAMGFTVDRDGWRFEPVPDENYVMRCRGQAVPTSKEVVYEVFVEECFDGPTPTLYADLLCTVDGLKAFHCRRMGMRLVADWPLRTNPEIADGPRALVRHGDRPVASSDGFEFDFDSLLACAWGTPTAAFGPRYAPFEQAGSRVARLPGPPYHFMSRVTDITGPMAGLEVGTRAVVEYDVPNHAWFFDESPSGTMPYCVLLEAGLQPCGWLASYIGCTLIDPSHEIFFRNLDGTGIAHREVNREDDVIRTELELKSLSRAGGMIIVSFEVRMTVDGMPLFDMDTVFGFFPAEALAAQAGVTVPPENPAVEASLAPADQPIRFIGKTPHLSLLDRMIAFEPEGGQSGLGSGVAVYEPDPNDWFFKAHFFQDAVQPGSIGLEALLQLVGEIALRKGLVTDTARCEAIACGVEHSWVYRGQVLPHAQKATFVVDITDVSTDSHGLVIRADGALWVDDETCIYTASNLALRFNDGPESARVITGSELAGSIWPTWKPLVNATDGWLGQRLFTPLLETYVGRVFGTHHLESVDGPVLFLANHQVQIESLLLTTMMTGLTGRNVVALSNAKHKTRWIGPLSQKIWTSQPTLNDPEHIIYFERDDQASLFAIIEVMKARVATGESLMIHAAGTRNRSAHDSTTTVSSAILDMVIALDIPIMPVRITGGLPVEPTDGKLDFPVGHAAQDYWIGAPITASLLGELPYAERREHVLNAIISLAMPSSLEEPNPANRELESMSTYGIDSVRAVLKSLADFDL